MPVTPNRNLPPEAEPWGRWVEEQLRNGSLGLIRADEDAINSFKGINGALTQLSKQVAALNTVTSELAAQQATLASQQTTLAAQQANLAARITTSSSITSFNTGTLPNDSAEHTYGPSIPITVNVPTGRLVVTVGCGEISVNPGSAASGAALGIASFSISGGVAALGTYVANVYTGSTNWIGSGASVTRSFSVTPGTYTVTGQMSAAAYGTTNANVQFTQPYLTVQVTG